MMSFPARRPLSKRTPGSAVLAVVFYLFRNLDAGLGRFPSLSLHCQNFLIANISMISRTLRPDRLKKASKKSLTQFVIL